MTQIAATIATMTHKTPPTGKPPATAGGGGMDFSAIVAGLASGDTVAPEGEAVTSDDANAETGQELPAELTPSLWRSTTRRSGRLPMGRICFRLVGWLICWGGCAISTS